MKKLQQKYENGNRVDLCIEFHWWPLNSTDQPTVFHGIQLSSIICAHDVKLNTADFLNFSGIQDAGQWNNRWVQFFLTSHKLY